MGLDKPADWADRPGRGGDEVSHLGPRHPVVENLDYLLRVLDCVISNRFSTNTQTEPQRVPSYLPAEDRYRSMTYRRCGRSGLLLPAVSFGLWQNFGDDRPLETQRAVLRRAFDLESLIST